MSGIIRQAPRRDFASIPNDLLNNSALSWEARGLLSYLLSKPADWTVSKQDLINQSPAGRDKTGGILRELENAGYLLRECAHNSDTGRFEWFTTVYDTPQEITEDSIEPDESKELNLLPDTENPYAAKPLTVKASIYKDRETKTEITKTKGVVVNTQPTAQQQPEQSSQPPTTHTAKSKLLPAVLDALGRNCKTRYEMGNLPLTVRMSIETGAKCLEAQGYSAADVQSVSLNFPAYIRRLTGKTGEISAPTPEQFFRDFERIHQQNPMPQISQETANLERATQDYRSRMDARRAARLAELAAEQNQPQFSGCAQ